MHILFCHQNQKNLLQKEIKNWVFESYLLTKETIDSRSWIMENDLCQIFCAWFLNFYQTERFWIVFCGMSYPNPVK